MSLDSPRDGQPSDDWRQPTLEGERLLLRPLAEHDRGALFAVAADRLIWEQHPAWDRWQEPVFRAFFDDALAQRGAVVVIDRATGAIIGSSRWQEFDCQRSQVEIGWTFLARDYWGTGVNHELKRLMLGHAFGHVETVVLHVGEDNIRSRRAVEAIGGVLTAETVIAQRGGAAVLHVVYAITRQAFAGGPLAA